MPRPLSSDVYISPFAKRDLSDLFDGMRLIEPKKMIKEEYVTPQLPWTMRCVNKDPRAPWNKLDLLMDKLEKFKVSDPAENDVKRRKPVSTASQPYVRKRPSTIHKILQSHGIEKTPTSQATPKKHSGDRYINANIELLYSPQLPNAVARGFDMPWWPPRPPPRNQAPTLDQLLTTLNRVQGVLQHNNTAPTNLSQNISQVTLPAIVTLPTVEEPVKPGAKVTKTRTKNVQATPYTKEKSARKVKLARIEEAAVVHARATAINGYHRLRAKENIQVPPASKFCSMPRRIDRVYGAGCSWEPTLNLVEMIYTED